MIAILLDRRVILLPFSRAVKCNLCHLIPLSMKNGTAEPDSINLSKAPPRLLMTSNVPQMAAEPVFRSFPVLLWAYTTSSQTVTDYFLVSLAASVYSLGVIAVPRAVLTVPVLRECLSVSPCDGCFLHPELHLQPPGGNCRALHVPISTSLLSGPDDVSDGDLHPALIWLVALMGWHETLNHPGFCFFVFFVPVP